MTSIVVIFIPVASANINVFNRFVATSSVICSALVAELMAASACHVVASFVLFDPKLASSALLCFCSIEPLLKCEIAFIHASFNLSLMFFCASLLFFYQDSSLILLASLALVINGLAFEAVGNLAAWAVMALDYIFLAKAVIVAVICGALNVVTRLSIPDHLPLMASPTNQFLKLKDNFKVSVP